MKFDSGGMGTHEALLIGVQPIRRERKRELSESQVREALDKCDDIMGWGEAKELVLNRLFNTHGTAEGPSHE